MYEIYYRPFQVMCETYVDMYTDTLFPSTLSRNPIY
jgi:hypothetical protein